MAKGVEECVRGRKRKDGYLLRRTHSDCAFHVSHRVAWHVYLGRGCGRRSGGWSSRRLLGERGVGDDGREVVAECHRCARLSRGRRPRCAMLRSRCDCGRVRGWSIDKCYGGCDHDHGVADRVGKGNLCGRMVASGDLGDGGCGGVGTVWSVTGHIVVDTAMISVVTAPMVGQLVTSGAQEVTV